MIQFIVRCHEGITVVIDINNLREFFIIQQHPVSIKKTVDFLLQDIRCQDGFGLVAGSHHTQHLFIGCAEAPENKTVRAYAFKIGKIGFSRRQRQCSLIL